MNPSDAMRRREVAAARTRYAQTIDAQAMGSTSDFEVVNPATGQAFARSPAADRSQLDAAVNAATAAAPAWARLGFEARRAHLLRFGQFLVANADELASLTTLEQGKPFTRAMDEVTRTALTIERVTSIRIDVEVLKSNALGRVEMHYRPLGVVGAITPWNVPVGLAMGKIVHALYTGNALILKPSPYTPLATLRIGEIGRAVFPPGVFSVLAGRDELGRWMTEHPGIHKISFTGSGPTGRRVMASAASNLKRVTLELGGNDAAIVLPKSDIHAIAGRLYAAAFSNSGQICMAIKRLYVHASQHDELCEAIGSLARKARVGDGFEDGVEMGPVQNAAQRALVVELLDDARLRGGEFIAGGACARPPGLLHRTDGCRGPSRKQSPCAGRAFRPSPAHPGLRRRSRGTRARQRHVIRPQRLRMGTRCEPRCAAGCATGGGYGVGQPASGAGPIRALRWRQAVGPRPGVLEPRAQELHGGHCAACTRRNLMRRHRHRAFQERT
ncbi:aldehyde dehydrogenase family protein [Variovorax sp. J22R187]|nr:aldehyde dehydrogenase family protein [Variovorax sp. J22R187]MDM0021909.1 aldehyde dehydrogenase family protein [Variovorax sp. J22R187]